MRFDINLASERYIDARRFYSRWVPVLTVLVVSTIGLLGLAYARHRDVRDLGAQIAAMREKNHKLDMERAAGEALLNQPENSRTRAQSQFFNGLFVRKSLSWTALLSELEQIMPPRVQVVGIHPQLKPDGTLLIQFTIAAERREDAVEFVRKLEGSPHFAEPELTRESDKRAGLGLSGPGPSGAGPTGTVFEVLAYYVRGAETIKPTQGEGR